MTKMADDAFLPCASWRALTLGDILARKKR